MSKRRLTSFSHGAGCGCKLGPGQLSELMEGVRLPVAAPEVLISAATSDDAAVYRIAEDRALVATVDFFTPIVDDPYEWGRIAAVNAMSDVWAMGGQPAIALNLVSWPVDDLPMYQLQEVLKGGATAAAHAGVAVLGGHSITDPEPKYGMCVIGFVDPRVMTTNSAAMPGDRLFLTKPLGLGLIATAIKRGEATEVQIASAIGTMTQSNAAASEAMVSAGVRAATDVTGFGLLGHLREMLLASRVSAVVDAAGPALLPGALDLARRDVVPGGTLRNHAFVGKNTDWGELTEAEQLVLADAQTSGGLLIAGGDAVEEALTTGNVPWANVGRIEGGRPGEIRVEGRLAG